MDPGKERENWSGQEAGFKGAERSLLIEKISDFLVLASVSGHLLPSWRAAQQVQQHELVLRAGVAPGHSVCRCFFLPWWDRYIPLQPPVLPSCTWMVGSPVQCGQAEIFRPPSYNHLAPRGIFYCLI